MISSPDFILQVPFLIVWIASISVSYTHLDVYKRQTIDTSAPFESYLKDSANENVVVPVEDAP